MGYYADINLGDDRDYGEKDCPECDGFGEIYVGYDDDEEPQLGTCERCYGSGKVDRDIHDEIDDEWDAKCEP